MPNERQSPIPEEELARRQPKRKIGCVTMGLGTVVCVASALAVSFFLWNKAASRRFDNAIAALRAIGAPASREELEAAYQAPTADNPGPLFVKIGTALDTAVNKKLPFMGSEGEDPAKPGEPWDALEISRDYLVTHADSLAELQSVAKMRTPARYKLELVPYDPAKAMDIPYVRSHRHICRAMGLASYVYAHDGRPEKVTECIEIGLRTGMSLQDEPKVLGQLLSVACTQMMLNLIHELIAVDFTDDQLAQLQRTLRERDPRASLVCGLQGEAVLVIENFLNPKFTGPIPRYEDAAFFVEQMTPVLEIAANGSWQEVLKASKDLDETSQRVTADRVASTRYALSTGALNASSRTVVAHARTLAGIRVIDTLLAARRYQLKNGELPESLNQLVGEFLAETPLDPFGAADQTLIFRRLPDKLMIYSRGVNATDDQGDASFDNTGHQVDIVVELQP